MIKRWAAVFPEKIARKAVYPLFLFVIVFLVISPAAGTPEAAFEVHPISWVSLVIFVIAFLCGYLDASLGMGYGSALTPVLLLFGFDPLQIVPIVLLSQFVGGMVGGFAHHKVGNVNLKPGSRAFKTAVILGIFSIAGIIIAVWLATYVSAHALGIIIGAIITLVGIAVLLTYNKKFEFAWWKLIVVGTIAAFNKSISGGGYGPLVTGGQIVSGVKGREAVAITNLAEGFVCLTALILYYAVGTKIYWGLAPAIVLGALASVPFAAITVKAIRSRALNLIIGFFTTILGMAALAKALFDLPATK